MDENILHASKRKAVELKENIGNSNLQDKTVFSNPEIQDISVKPQTNPSTEKNILPRSCSKTELVTRGDESNLSEENEANKKGSLVEMGKNHPLALVALNVILCVVNLALILICLCGCPKMPELNLGLSNFKMPAVLTVDLSEVEFNDIGSCVMVSIIVPFVFMDLGYYLSQLSTVHSTGNTKNVELNKTDEEVSREEVRRFSAYTKSGYEPDSEGTKTDSVWIWTHSGYRTGPPVPRPTQSKAGTDEPNGNVHDTLGLKGESTVKTHT